MPSSATITAFYNFSANTKARASQVTNNFDVFRGHIVPVHVSTATSADNTYDLGSTEYRWRNAYLNNIYLGLTTTGWSISDNTSTSGDFIIQNNGVTKLRLRGTSISMTTTAAVGQLARSSLIVATGNSGTSETNIAGSTLTISSTGKGIRFQLVPQANTLGSFETGNSAAPLTRVLIRLYRGGTNLINYFWISPDQPPGPAGLAYYNPNSICFFDYNPTTTSENYHLSFQGNAAGDYIHLANLYLIAHDI